MTRSEYLTAIATLLQDISVEERKEAMKFYNDYFDEAGDENADQAIEDLGSPEEVARKIRESPGNNEFVKTPVEDITNTGLTYATANYATPVKKPFPVWGIVLIAIGALLILCLPIILAMRGVSKITRSYTVTRSISERADTDNYTDGIMASDVKDIKISIDFGEVSVVTDSNLETIYCSYEDVMFGEISEDIKGDTYDFKYDGEKSAYVSNIKGPEFTIYIPEDFECEDISISVGAGNLTLSGDIISKGVIDINVGAGNLEVSGWEAEDIKINCGCGNIEFEGKINSDFEAKLGAGNIEVELDGKEKDYDYYIDGALGNFSLNGRTSSGLVGSQKIKNDASKKIDIECALGDISIKTK